MKAQVVSGNGEGAKYVEVYASKIEKAVGLYPYPGTLNLKIKELPPLEFVEIEGFGKFGSVELAPCSVNGERAFAVFPEKGGHRKDVIEVVAEKNLRDFFGLKDGSFVDIQF